MNPLLPPGSVILRFLSVFLLLSPVSFAADHNDPNAINSIFSDIDANAADLYDLYGFPSDDAAGGEKVGHRADVRLCPGDRLIRSGPAFSDLDYSQSANCPAS